MATVKSCCAGKLAGLGIDVALQKRRCLHSDPNPVARPQGAEQLGECDNLKARDLQRALDVPKYLMDAHAVLFLVYKLIKNR